MTLRLLALDDDADIRDALMLVFEEAGYDIVVVSSLDEAVALIDRETFHLILTDSFSNTPLGGMPALRQLQQRAQPTPVGILSAWNFSQADLEDARFAFVMAKPFDIDQLLAQVAAALQIPLTPAQQRQEPVVRRYFAALTARNWDALLDVCAEDVVYVLPSGTPFSGTYAGKEAFRAYTESTFSQFPAARFEDIHVYSTPKGLAARYRGVWRLPDGSEPQLTGAVYFQFEGERISQIGVQLHDERLRALLEAPSPPES